MLLVKWVVVLETALEVLILLVESVLVLEISLEVSVSLLVVWAVKVLALVCVLMLVLEIVSVDTVVDEPEELVDSTTVYVLSQGSVTVTVLVPDVTVNVVVPLDVTTRVEQASQCLVVVVPLKVGVETVAELSGVVVVLLLVTEAGAEDGTGVLELEGTVDVDTIVEDPEVLVDSITVYVLSHGSVTVTVVVPDVRTNVVVPEEVTVRVEQTWQGLVVVVVPIEEEVEIRADSEGGTVIVETNVEDPKELVDSTTV